jgi:hypothetical protein
MRIEVNLKTKKTFEFLSLIFSFKKIDKEEEHGFLFVQNALLFTLLCLNKPNRGRHS